MELEQQKLLEKLEKTTKELKQTQEKLKLSEENLLKAHEINKELMVDVRQEINSIKSEYDKINNLNNTLYKQVKIWEDLFKDITYFAKVKPDDCIEALCNLYEQFIIKEDEEENKSTSKKNKNNNNFKLIKGGRNKKDS